MSEQRDAGADGSTTADEVGETWDAEFSAFLGHSFDGPDEEEASGDPPSSGEASESAATAPQTVNGSDGSDALASPNPDPATDAANGETPPVKDAADGGTPDPDEISPADLAAMLDLADAPKPQGQDTQTAKEEPKPSAAQAEDEPFMPFTPSFKLPKEMSAALFESEDPEQREAALVGLLSSFGNTMTQVIEKRFKEYYAPLIAAQAMSGVQERQAASAVLNHFYSENKDLLPYSKAVNKAFQLAAQQGGGPNTPYTPELAKKVAQLTRAALKASGIDLKPASPAAAPASVKKTPAARAPGNGFEAGAGRPSVSSPNADDPAGMLASLSEF